MKFSDYQYPCTGIQPFEKQRETVRFLLQPNHKRAFVLNEMGTGKTLSSLWAADFLMAAGKVCNVLIICPLSTMEFVWWSEIFKHLPHRSATVVHGTKAQRITALKQLSDFFIINHDGIKVVEKELRARKFDIIIIDELTAFKTFTAARSKCLYRITTDDHVKAVWGMTGSPTSNSPLEAFGQAKIVNPYNKYLPRFFGQYRDMVMTQLDEYTYIPKPNWEKYVAAILSPAIRVKLTECTDLPETINEYRRVEMSKEQAPIYKSLKDDYMAQLENGTITAANAGVKTLKLLQVACGTVFDDDHEVQYLDISSKLSELIRLYEENDEDKMIVYTLFRPSVERLKEYFRSKGISAEAVYGGVSKAERTKIFHEFQSGDLKIIIVQPQSAAHGLTLTACRTIVWFTPIPSNEVYVQANARVVRPGQTRTQLILRLSCCQAEDRLYKALDNKERMSQALLELF